MVPRPYIAASAANSSAIASVAARLARAQPAGFRVRGRGGPDRRRRRARDEINPPCRSPRRGAPGAARCGLRRSHSASAGRPAWHRRPASVQSLRLMRLAEASSVVNGSPDFSSLHAGFVAGCRQCRHFFEVAFAVRLWPFVRAHWSFGKPSALAVSGINPSSGYWRPGSRFTHRILDRPFLG